MSYCTLGTTNAVAEENNGKIMAIKRRVGSYRNRQNFKTAIYFYCVAKPLPVIIPDESNIWQHLTSMSTKFNTKNYLSNNYSTISEQDSSDGKLPYVSILVWAFNNSDTIAHCIESILHQETDFPVELLIHDDASTDGTTTIILEYERKYPGTIKSIIQKENQYSKNKSVMTTMLAQSRGNYIALCDADDYWIDKRKIKTQVTFLDDHPDHAICFHRVKLLDNNNLLTDDNITLPHCYSDLSDIAHHGNLIRTTSVMLRNVVKDFPTELTTLPAGDFPLYMFAAQFGKVGFIPELMAVYRVGTGIWSSKPVLWQIHNTIVCYAGLYDYFLNVNRMDIANICASKVKWFLDHYWDELSDADVADVLRNPAIACYLIRSLNSRLRATEELNTINFLSAASSFKSYFFRFLSRLALLKSR